MGPRACLSVSALIQQRLNQHARRSHRPTDVPKRTQVRDNFSGQIRPQGYKAMNETTTTQQIAQDSKVIREVVERLAKREQSTTGNMDTATTAIQQALGIHSGYARLLDKAAGSDAQVYAWRNTGAGAVDSRFVNAINVVASDPAVRGKPDADQIAELGDVILMSPLCRRVMAAYAEHVQMQAESTARTKSQTVRAWGQRAFAFSNDPVKHEGYVHTKAGFVRTQG